ncbi:ABC transporter permease [Oleiharenicola lentus]|uniref:ABC transporter permease n=1 Tax=Oleiharenicola lentus TaxID=2508720 RepID=UPI003F663132
MLSDLTYAVRQLLKAPLVTSAAILSLSLALGANTALFSIFDKLVLRPHAFPEPSALVRVWTNNPATNFVGPAFSLPKYELIRDHQSAFSAFAASAFAGFAFVRDGGEPEQITGLRVTRDFFPALGVPMARGRVFSLDEDKPGAAPAVVISHEFWQTRLGSRENVDGDMLNLNGLPHTITGVLPPQLGTPFTTTLVFTNRVQEPAGLNVDQVRVGATYLQVTARLKPGVSFQQANEQIVQLNQRYAAEFSDRLDAKNPIELRTLTEELAGNLRPTLRMLLGAVAAVLLIACANVSNLFLARLSSRQKEIAVRLSLGATRQHLIRQFLLESLLFAVSAALLGLALAKLGLIGVEQLAANQLAPNTTFALNGPTLAFSGALCLLSALAVGLVPALQASRLGLSDVLKDAGRGTPGGARSGRFRSVLIVAEVGLSVVLLVGSALLLLSFARLQKTPSGINPEGIAYAFVNAPVERYRTPVQQAEFHERVLERLKANPQVTHAAAALAVPLGGGPIAPYTIFGTTVLPIAERPLASLQAVTPEFFQAFQITLREGRTFTTQDRTGTPGVCVINESFAKRIFPGESALGKVLTRGRDADVKHEIVGIVADVRSNGLGAPPPDVVYYPFYQLPRSGANVIVRTTGDPAGLQAVIRTAVAEIDRQQPLAFFNTMQTLVTTNTGFQRLVASLTGIFAAVALLLTAIGLYSVLAYSVAQRTSEIGIRMALGASRSDVVSMVLKHGMRLVVIGLFIGLAAAAGTSYLIRSLLFSVEPVNPVLYGGVSVLFALIALVACLLPSLKAARIDPLVALRSD